MQVIKWLLDRPPEFWTAIASLAIASFTGTLWFSTHRLWRVTKAALSHAEQTAIRELRAYVSVKEIVMDQFRGPDMVGTSVNAIVPGPIHSHRISVIFENGGKTPTRKAIVNINRQLRDDELPDNFDFPDGELVEPAAVGANGGVYITPGFFISTSEVALVAAKQKRLFVWGWVEYDDVFDGTPRHRTEFCLDTTADTASDRGNTYLRFPTYGRFNGIDGDCVRKPRPYQQPT